jgi:hypothetical protein
MSCEASISRVVDATIVDVGDDDSRASSLPGHGCGQEANSSSTEHKGGRTRDGTGAIDSMDGNRQRLKKSGGGI